MKECYTTKSNYRNSAGQYEDIVVCYCGTTACTKGLITNYPIPVKPSIDEIQKLLRINQTPHIKR